MRDSTRIAQALAEADEVSALIEAGKRVPRGMTESLRNHVRALVAMLSAAPAPDKAEPGPTLESLGAQLTDMAHKLGEARHQHEQDQQNSDYLIATIITNLRHGTSAEKVVNWYDTEVAAKRPYIHLKPPPPASWPPEMVAEARRAGPTAAEIEKVLRLHIEAQTEDEYAEIHGFSEAAAAVSALAPPASDVRREALEEAANYLDRESNEHWVFATTKADAVLNLSEREAQMSISLRLADAAAAIRSLAGESGGGE